MSDVTLTRNAPDATAGEARGGLLRLPFALRGKAKPDYPAIRTLCEYWEQRRGNRLAPARSEIEAAPLAGMLRFMFIAEIIAPGVARLRFAGQHLHDLLGMEPRGMPLSCLLAAPSRDELAKALTGVQKGARVQMPLRAARGLGKPAMDGLLALLPLTDSAGNMTRVLGMIETHGQIGRTPRRFDLAAAPSGLDVSGLDALPQPMETDDARAPTGRDTLEGRPREAASTGAKAGGNRAAAAPATGRPAHAARPGWRVITGGRG